MGRPHQSPQSIEKEKLMKRILALALLLLPLLLLPTCETCFAQNAAPKEQKENPAPEWKKLGEGVQVLKLWESIGPQWPQVVLLKLSREEYKEFHKHPMEYLNKLKVFGDTPTRRVVRCHLARIEEKVAKSPSIEYLVVGKHDYDSTSLVTSSSYEKK
jgi:hypothetical protein